MDNEMVLERTIFCTIASFEYKPMVELLVEKMVEMKVAKRVERQADRMVATMVD
jgi:hypothetical protein